MILSTVTGGMLFYVRTRTFTVIYQLLMKKSEPWRNSCVLMFMGTVDLNSMSINIQQAATVHSFLYCCTVNFV